MTEITGTRDVSNSGMKFGGMFSSSIVWFLSLVSKFPHVCSTHLKNVSHRKLFDYFYKISKYFESSLSKADQVPPKDKLSKVQRSLHYFNKYFQYSNTLMQQQIMF